MPHTPDPEVKMEMDLDPWSGTGPGMDPKEFEELVERYVPFCWSLAGIERIERPLL
jgi:hypothetical protein